MTATPLTDAPAPPAAPAQAAGGPLVEAVELCKYFPVRRGWFRASRDAVRAVDRVSFAIQPGDTYALVGESGCGKTTTGRLLLRLIDPSAGLIRFEGGTVWSDGRHGVAEGRARGRALRAMRRRMQIVFQDPQSSLNPRMRVGDAVGEGLLLHAPELDAARRAERIGELLALVGLPPESARRWPHEFSGGQRQRVGIARALAVDPRFIVCDEAVSALDVSIQAQIINLLADLRERLGLTYLFIAHDLAVVRHLATRVGVMYAGHLMEEGPADAVLTRPYHPYAQALVAAAPDIRRRVGRGGPRFVPLPGEVPRPDRPPPGCRFQTRCPRADAACRQGDIPEQSVDGRRVKCLRPGSLSPNDKP